MAKIILSVTIIPEPTPSDDIESLRKEIFNALSMFKVKDILLTYEDKSNENRTREYSDLRRAIE